MTPYNLNSGLYRARQADRTSLADPGSGGTVQVTPNDLSVLVATTTGARTLQAASELPVGTSLLAISQAAGVTVNNVDLADGEFALFIVTLDSSGNEQWVVATSTQVAAAFTGTKTLEIPINNNWRVWDALITNLAAADGTDDLGLVTGVYLTSGPSFNVTVATPSGAPFYARDPNVVVPANYKAGTNLTLKITVTENVAATTATVDANIVRQSAPSVDLVATAAQSVVGAAATEYSFTVTGTNVQPGEALDLRIFLTLTDASATPNYDITNVELEYSAE